MFMKSKSMMAGIVVMGFLLGLLGPSYGQGQKMEAKGTVAKVEGKTVLLKEEGGKTIILKLEDVQGIKVGDKGEVKNGSFFIIDKTTGKTQEPRKLKIEKPT